jgi:hypothetical protein
MPEIRFSSDIQDIININSRSAQAKTGISIIELSMLDGLMDSQTAESIRKEIFSNNVTVRQLTNLSEIYADWKQYSAEFQKIMQIRYIPKYLFDIQTEILIFDDIVAMYRVDPEVYYVEIEDAQYASMMRLFFENLWNASQIMTWWIWGSAAAKQYLPFRMFHKNIPLVIYPAKDDGNIVQAYQDKNGIEKYVQEISTYYTEQLSNADMVIIYVWNDSKTRMADIWKVSRNTISDDSWFLYDGFTLRELAIESGMWTASWNSLIVFTAEELLLRKLILEQGKTFEEASDREKYFPAFPSGLIPKESF